MVLAARAQAGAGEWPRPDTGRAAGRAQSPLVRRRRCEVRAARRGPPRLHRLAVAGRARLGRRLPDRRTATRRSRGRRHTRRHHRRAYGRLPPGTGESCRAIRGTSNLRRWLRIGSARPARARHVATPRYRPARPTTRRHVACDLGATCGAAMPPSPRPPRARHRWGPPHASACPRARRHRLGDVARVGIRDRACVVRFIPVDAELVAFHRRATARHPRGAAGRVR